MIDGDLMAPSSWWNVSSWSSKKLGDVAQIVRSPNRDAHAAGVLKSRRRMITALVYIQPQTLDLKAQFIPTQVSVIKKKNGKH